VGAGSFGRCVLVLGLCCGGLGLALGSWAHERAWNLVEPSPAESNWVGAGGEWVGMCGHAYVTQTPSEHSHSHAHRTGPSRAHVNADVT